MRAVPLVLLAGAATASAFVVPTGPSSRGQVSSFERHYIAMAAIVYFSYFDAFITHALEA